MLGKVDALLNRLEDIIGVDYLGTLTIGLDEAAVADMLIDAAQTFTTNNGANMVFGLLMAANSRKTS